MTAKIYQFKIPPKDPVVEKSNREIYADVFEDVLGEWQRSALRDQLNEYIASKLPPKFRKGTVPNYVNDLDRLSKLEQKLGISVTVFGPGGTTSNPIGFMAAFQRGDELYATSPDMASESSARAMNIVLCLSFDKTLKSLNRD